ncbi:hypothetical protein NB16F80_45250 [Escherichia coli]
MGSCAAPSAKGDDKFITTDYLQQCPWGRIQLTDAIAELAKKQSVDAMLMTGDSYDCGKKMGYMQAFVKYGLRNLKEGPKFRKSIEKLLGE